MSMLQSFYQSLLSDEGYVDHSKLFISQAHVVSAAARFGVDLSALGSTIWSSFVVNAEKVVAIATPYAEQATLSFPGLDRSVEGLATSVGQDTATLKYLLVLLAAYPISLIFASVKSATLKHVANAALGVFFAQWVFGSAWIHSLISAAVAYALMAVGVVVPPLRGVTHLLVFAWMMAYMTASHLYRLHVDYMGWSLDFTGPQMLLTIKLTSLAYNMYDGLAQKARYERKVKELQEANAVATKNGDEKAAKSASYKSRILSERLDRAVTSLPSPLAYLGYVYCYTSFFAGPAFEYAEYDRAVKETLFKGANGQTDLQWGSRRIATAKKALTGLLFLGLTAFGRAKFPFDAAFNSQELLHAPVLQRLAYIWVALFFTRCKYYFAWMIAEGSANLAGYGYRLSKDPKKPSDWEGSKNIDILGVEFAPSMSAYSRAWNMSTQNWLSRYCHYRVGELWGESAGMIATYTLSAVWHGFYPGYYLFFLSIPLIQNVDKTLSRKIKPRMKALGGTVATVYDYVGRLVATCALAYLVCPFVALGWDEGVTVWASLYYVGHIVGFVAYVVLALVPEYRAPKAATSEKNEKAAPSSSSKKAGGKKDD